MQSNLGIIGEVCCIYLHKIGRTKMKNTSPSRSHVNFLNVYQTQHYSKIKQRDYYKSNYQRVLFLFLSNKYFEHTQIRII